MHTDSNTTMTDSLERILIEREANAMRGMVDAETWRALAAGPGRLWRAAAATLGSLRSRARDARVDYAAG